MMDTCEHIDDDLRSTADLLETAAERARAEPGDAFEDRVFMATRSTRRVSRPLWASPMLKIAAVLALGGGALLVLLRPGVFSTTATTDQEVAALEADIEEWLELTDTFDNGWATAFDAAATEVSILSTQDLGEFVDEESL